MALGIFLKVAAAAAAVPSLRGCPVCRSVDASSQGGRARACERVGL